MIMDMHKRTEFASKPDFMGAYRNLPKNAKKIADICHDFVQVILQYDVTVYTSVYFSQTGSCNVSGIYLKTDFKSLETMIDKIVPSYD